MFLLSDGDGRISSLLCSGGVGAGWLPTDRPRLECLGGRRHDLSETYSQMGPPGAT